MSENATPHRLVLSFQAFAPGYTSGAVQDTETLEFRIEGPGRKRSDLDIEVD